MAVPRPPAARSGGEQDAEDTNTTAVPWLRVVLQTMFFMFVYQFFIANRAAPQEKRDAAAASGVSGVAGVSSAAPRQGHVFYDPLFADGAEAYMSIYINEQSSFGLNPSETAAIWEKSLAIGNWSQHPDIDPSFAITHALPISDNVKNNGSLYVHVVLSGPAHLLGSAVDSCSAVGDECSGETNGDAVIVTRTQQLTIYKEVAKANTKKRLLFEDEVDANAEPTPTPHADGTIIAYWHPNITINLVYDMGKIARKQLPEPCLQYLNFNDESLTYDNVIYVNNFWNLAEDRIPVNDTLDTLQVHLQVYPVGLFKWNFFLSMKESMRQQQMFGGAAAGESDMMKRMLTDTNPILLVVTMIVTVLHTVFDILAFKNDIQFWKNRKSVEGLSIRTIFTNLFFQIVIFLYLVDNETSAMILFSTGTGILIEMWKVTKASDVTVHHNQRWFGIIPKVSFDDKKSYAVSKTKEYDDYAYSFLGKLLGPCIALYSIYALYYNEYKSVYSWVINSLVGAIYTFGFIAMTPQLFINYKLKSVAHMPWRMMTYKALNTFIDDLFAFIITMPWLHRLACLRDDVIFFVYLYQKWVYPVDPNRRNEFEGGDAAGNKDETESGGDIDTLKDAVSPVEDATKSPSVAADATITSKKRNETEDRTATGNGDEAETSDDNTAGK
ncbi:hypothetical protein SARC_02136 [Sphaeroforma arctica JP610]|uniref:Cleft lip and palate transmembrane protein 1 n=1 Tax=Sphaeroforma arctica JP610 TaxID=667725 RepID=A0A0L0G9I7_9EUKA|nr:hypothetical protein SARC_02136 [Sphaeroforma arctica JP610]KNC85687.1 hypothetical protein SARC_02136 [Sphaeroforma arctica JP610]|eukprot:XP_014159589.1 hypothetical protein SARC_02136 [Sphaeroforma arctica JP610]